MTMMDTLVGRVDDTLSARRVFGEPVIKNGITVIPVARVMGGGGAGEGPTPPTTDATTGEVRTTQQSGGGFGLAARPAGVYVLQGEKVRWIPALDLNRVLFGMQILAIVALLTVRSIMRSRAART